MRGSLLALLLVANTQSPAPLPDASPTLRGAINTSKDQRLSGKVFVDRVRVEPDAGAGFSSSCVVNAAALGVCPQGNGLQCVLDAGWYACLLDGGWAPLVSIGSGAVTSVDVSAPLTTTGGFTPTLGCAAAAASTPGCVTASAQDVSGAKTFIDGITGNLDAGVVISGHYEGPISSSPFSVIAHNGAGTFNNAFVWDVQPANARDIETYVWENGGVEAMGLEIVPSSRPVTLNVYGEISPTVGITNKASGSTGTIAITSNMPGGTGTPAVTFDTVNANVSGQCQYVWKNGGALYVCMEPVSFFPQSNGILSVTGQVSAAGDSSHGALLIGQNGSGTVAVECANQGNGCYVPLMSHMSNGSSHGALTILNDATLPDGGFRNMDGGLMFEARNPAALGFPPSSSNDGVFEIDWMGGFGNAFRGATFAAGQHQIPQACDHNAPNNEVGHGSATGYLNYLGDTTHYYLTKCGDLPDAGDTGYKQIAEENALWLPPFFVNATLAASSTLWAEILPPDSPITLSALSLYINPPGSGGTTNAIIRATNLAGDQCNFSFPCNTGSGPLRVAATGICNTIIRSDALTWTVPSTGDCGVKPSLVGNVAQEFHYR